MATELYSELEKRGYSVWLDVKMENPDEAAMEEGVKYSTSFIAVITGPCVNNDKPDDDQDGNAYFRRPYCIKELQWAYDAEVPIVPVVRNEDKQNIGTFLDLLDKPLKVDGDLQDVSDLKRLGRTPWIDLNRNDPDYWELGVKKVLKQAGRSSASPQRGKVRSPSGGGAASTAAVSSSVAANPTSAGRRVVILPRRMGAFDPSDPSASRPLVDPTGSTLKPKVADAEAWEAMEQTLVDARAAGDALEGMAVGEAIDLAGIATIHVPPKTPNGTVVEGEAAESSALRGAGTQGGRGFPAMDARGSESDAGSGSGGGAGEDGMDVSCDET